MAYSIDIPIKMWGSTAAPEYAKPGDAGLDLRICHECTLTPGEIQLRGVGFNIAIPKTFKDFRLMGLVVPRSSSKDLDIRLANTVGVIDSGYRGEVKLAIKNCSMYNTVRLEAQQKVAQLIIMPYLSANFVEVDGLPKSERGSGGWGHTGKV